MIIFFPAPSAAFLPAKPAEDFLFHLEYWILLYQYFQIIYKYYHLQKDRDQLLYYTCQRKQNAKWNDIPEQELIFQKVMYNESDLKNAA